LNNSFLICYWYKFLPHNLTHDNILYNMRGIHGSGYCRVWIMILSLWDSGVRKYAAVSFNVRTLMWI